MVVETDGFRFHRDQRSFTRDRRRDQLLELEGWRCVRFTWEQVVDEPEQVVRVVRALLGPSAQ